ncbi:MAG: hypothetical protein A4E71_01231 [Smithella sp. PtaU1.Bin162]|nr:MAG: hypothetical protein A4E71_01231 [Smithella sp. PtaU1.Bin162]
MPSKSKDVRVEQCLILEKKLGLRLQKLDQKGMNKERAQRDPLVKNLKAKIRETKARIAAADKHVELTRTLVQAKLQKAAELEAQSKAAKAETSAEPAAAEAKQKKQSPEKAEAKKKPAAEKEAKPKKKAAVTEPAAADAEPPKKPRKKKEENKEE